MNASSETWRSFSLVDGLTVMFIMDLRHPPTSNRIYSSLDCDANGFGHNQLGRAVGYLFMRADKAYVYSPGRTRCVIIKIQPGSVLTPS